MRAAFAVGEVTKSRVTLNSHPQQCHDISAQSPQAGTTLLASLSSREPNVGLAPSGDLVRASQGASERSNGSSSAPSSGTDRNPRLQALVSSVLSSPSSVPHQRTSRDPQGDPRIRTSVQLSRITLALSRAPSSPWGTGAAAAETLQEGRGGIGQLPGMRASSTTGLCEVGPPLRFSEAPSLLGVVVAAICLPDPRNLGSVLLVRSLRAAAREAERGSASRSGPGSPMHSEPPAPASSFSIENTEAAVHTIMGGGAVLISDVIGPLTVAGRQEHQWFCQEGGGGMRQREGSAADPAGSAPLHQRTLVSQSHALLCCKMELRVPVHRRRGGLNVLLSSVCP